MRIRDISAIALLFLLVFSLLFEAAGHDHLERLDVDTRQCVIDHHAEHDRQPESSGPRLGPRAAEHEHECLGCRLGSQRSSLAKPHSTSAPLLVAQAAKIPGTSRPALLLPSTRTNRGPPAS